MKRKIVTLFCLLPTAYCLLAFGQGPTGQSVDPRSFVRIQLPADSPLELVKVDYDGSRVTRSAREVHFDLSLVLTLRNRSPRPVEGLALSLGYGFRNPGTEGLNAASGIRLRPGETFDLPARMRGDVEVPPAGSLARPVDLPSSARLSLDTVLFQDGSAFGPNRLGLLGPLRINQAEALRDRRYLEALAASGGSAAVARALERWEALWAQQSDRKSVV